MEGMEPVQAIELVFFFHLYGKVVFHFYIALKILNFTVDSDLIRHVVTGDVDYLISL